MIIDFIRRLFSSNSGQDLRADQLVFLDLETTGLYINRCGILEICLCDSSGATFTTLIDVGQSIPARITEINGIDRDMIVGMPMFSDIAHQVYAMIKEKTVVGHNVEFDLKFLFHGLLGAGIQPQPVKYICTYKAERMAHGNYGNKLHECLHRRGICSEQKHRALDDVNMVRQLFNHQMQERARFQVELFDLDKYKAFLLREPQPMFEPTPMKRSTHTLKMFGDWGGKNDSATISLFNQLIEHACQDRVFDADDMRKLAAIGIQKKTAIEQLKKGLKALVRDYYEDGKISWSEYKDMEDVAKLFGLNSSVFFPLIKEVVPDLKVVCFTNDLVLKGQVVDRYETLFPWAVSNGFLPSDSVTKQTDLVVNCGTKTSTTGKIDKANSYGIPVQHVSEFMKGKQQLAAGSPSK